MTRALLCLLAVFPLWAQPSRIAILSAAARAYTSHDPDPSVRNPDWLADPLLGPGEIALLENHPMGRAVNQDFRIAALDPEVSGLARASLVSTRYIDERLDQALRDGFTRIVILNAGLDTRAYRFRPRLLKTKVIEMDDAATQALKKERIETVLGPLPPYVSYLPMPAEVPRSPERTFYIWENASMYTPEAAVQKLLQSIAKSAPGSRLVMDYATAAQVELVNRDPASPQSHWDAGTYRQPWVFGVPGEAFFRSLGLEPDHELDTNSTEASKKYLTRRDGTTFGPARNAPGSGYEDAHALMLVELSVR